MSLIRCRHCGYMMNMEADTILQVCSKCGEIVWNRTEAKKSEEAKGARLC